MYFIPIVILATIYCFLDDRETETIIKNNNNINPQTYIIKRKKNNRNS